MNGSNVYAPASMTSDQVELAGVARQVLEGSDAGRAQIAALGWYGIGLEEELGGEGGSFADLAPVLEVCGEVRAESDLGWTTGVALPVMAAAERSTELVETMRRIVSGDAEVSIPVGDPVAVPEVETGLAIEVLGTGSPDADYLLLPSPSNREGPDGGVSLVTRGAGLVSSTPVTALDPTRPLARHTVDLAAAVPLTGADLVGVLQRRRAAVISLDSVGTARGALQATVSYARTREQFGRPIGSFQAYQHRCASAYIALKAAQALAYQAARDPEDERVCQAAAIEATRVSTFVCGEAVQLHGGVGFTWELGIGSSLRRARANQLVVLDEVTRLASTIRGADTVADD